MSRRHAFLMRHVGLHLYREGSMRTDLPVANCEGDLLSTSPEGRTYILKQWFRGAGVRYPEKPGTPGGDC